MKIAFAGSYGFGKTTLCQELLSAYGDKASFIDEFPRWIVSEGILSPAEMPNQQINVNDGIFLFFFGAAVSFYQQINCIDNNIVIIDWHPVVLQSYFDLFHEQQKISTRRHQEVQEFLSRMLVYFSKKIDITFYLPTGKIPLISDDIRCDNQPQQERLNTIIKGYLDRWCIRHCYPINEVHLEDRLNSVVSYIKRHQ